MREFSAKSSMQQEKEESKSPVKKRILLEHPLSPTKATSPSKQIKSMADSSSKYVNELEDVVLFCNKDTVMADFLDAKT